MMTDNNFLPMITLMLEYEGVQMGHEVFEVQMKKRGSHHRIDF